MRKWNTPSLIIVKPTSLLHRAHHSLWPPWATFSTTMAWPTLAIKYCRVEQTLRHDEPKRALLAHLKDKSPDTNCHHPLDYKELQKGIKNGLKEQQHHPLVNISAYISPYNGMWSIKMTRPHPPIPHQIWSPKDMTFFIWSLTSCLSRFNTPTLLIDGKWFGWYSSRRTWEILN